MPKIIELLGELMVRRDAALSESQPEKKREAAAAVIQDGMFILRQILGDEIVAEALGAVDDKDRQDILWNAGFRINMLSSFLVSMPIDAASPFKVAEEALSVCKGDAPLMFAKLGARKKNHRINMAKFEAFLWDAYLKGLGVRAGVRQDRIARAFGHMEGWETIRRGWRRDVAGLYPARTEAYLLLQAENEGRRGLPRWKLSEGVEWEEALVADGQHFLRVQKENVGNR